jgi:hypothetical protein
MPIDFPNSPATNDQFVSGGRTWIWDGSVWKAYTQALSNATVNTAILANDAVTSDKIANGTIVNADISNTAAINTTKITNWEDDQVVLAIQTFI